MNGRCDWCGRRMEADDGPSSEIDGCFCGEKCRLEYHKAQEEKWETELTDLYEGADLKNSDAKSREAREAREAKKAEEKRKKKARKVEKVKGVLAHIAAFVANLSAMQLFPSARGILFLYSIAFFISSWRTNRNDERNIYSLKHVLIWSAVGYIGATLLTIFL